MDMISIIAVTIFLVAYAFIATEKVHKVAAALGGAAGMVVLGMFRPEGHLVSAESAFFSARTGVDWRVVFLLFGMMVVVGVLRHTGLFEFIALWAAKVSKGSPLRLLMVLTLVTAVFSPILDNVTVVLLVTPITLSVCRRLKLNSMPYLITLVFAANIGGTSTLIGDPPNLIIGARAGLSFNDFIVHSLPLVVILMGVLMGGVALMFRRQLGQRFDIEEALGDVDPRDVIPNTAMLIRCLAVLAAIIVLFCLHSLTHMDPSIVAMLGAGAMVLVSGTTPKEFLQEVEWATLSFFMALFVLVGALVETGVIGTIGEFAADAMGGSVLAGVTGLLFGSAVIGGLVDNIPFATAMAPIVEQMVAATTHSGADSPLWWALVFGADLAGNATAVAAGANVVVLGLAAGAGKPVSFWQFTKYGVPFTIVTLVIAWLYVWLRYFVLLG